MSNSLVFMFSGQGSQYFHMGAKLFESEPLFRDVLSYAEEFTRTHFNVSWLSELYHPKNNKSDKFNKTLLTHPAIFIVEYALAHLLMDKYQLIPEYVLGTSLGEVTAAVVAGHITFEQGLHVVMCQALAIQESCPEGSMLAILNNKELYKNNLFLAENSEIAAINFDEHFIISGSLANINECENNLKNQNITTFLLPVSHGFHSKFIEMAQEKFINQIKSMEIKPGKYKMVSCIYGSEISLSNYRYFWELVREPILFQQAFKELESKDNFIYLDLGPFGTLATFVKYNLNPQSSSRFYPCLSPYSDDLILIKNVLDGVNKA